jgi:cell division protein FtsL
MARLNFLVGLLLLVAALSLVTSQHRARKLFIELERAQSASRQLEVEWGELRLEQTQLAKHSLIDAAARRELKMSPVTPSRTLYLGGAAGGAPEAARETAAAPLPPIARASVPTIPPSAARETR